MSIYHHFQPAFEHDCNENCYHRKETVVLLTKKNANPFYDGSTPTWEETMRKRRLSKKRLAGDITISFLSLFFPVILLMRWSGSMLESEFFQ